MIYMLSDLLSIFLEGYKSKFENNFKHYIYLEM